MIRASTRKTRPNAYAEKTELITRWAEWVTRQFQNIKEKGQQWHMHITEQTWDRIEHEQTQQLEPAEREILEAIHTMRTSAVRSRQKYKKRNNE